jgi:hypothetical protein
MPVGKMNPPPRNLHFIKHCGGFVKLLTRSGSDCLKCPDPGFMTTFLILKNPLKGTVSRVCG